MSLDEFEVLKKEPSRGIVGIDLSAGPRVKGVGILCEIGNPRDVTLLNA